MKKKKQVPLNTRRRKKYAEDESYREAAKDRARKLYRKNTKKEISSCLRSLDFYRTLCASIEVQLKDGSARKMPVMNLPNTADVLGKRYQTVWRWVKKGMIPAPVLTVNGRKESVFHADEVRVLIEEIGALEKKFAYYCRNHIQAKAKIFSRFDKVRNNLNIGE